MIISCMGHAKFVIELDNGLRIVTDPYDASCGYPVTANPADVVLVSHQHHDHNAVETIPGNPRVIDRAGDFDLGGGAAVRNNSAANGGGIYADGASVTVTVNGGVVGGTGAADANTATYGGGVFLNNGANLTLTGGLVTYNTATCGGGVAVGANSASTITATGASNIGYNTATRYGGGIYIGSGANANVTGATVSRNAVTLATNLGSGGPGGGGPVQGAQLALRHGGPSAGRGRMCGAAHQPVCPDPA